jgi:hypothetical protein
VLHFPGYRFALRECRHMPKAMGWLQKTWNCSEIRKGRLRQTGLSDSEEDMPQKRKQTWRALKTRVDTCTSHKVAKTIPQLRLKHLAQSLGQSSPRVYQWQVSLCSQSTVTESRVYTRQPQCPTRNPKFLKIWYNLKGKENPHMTQILNSQIRIFFFFWHYWGLLSGCSSC